MARELQTYLRTHGLEKLCEAFAIKASRHKEISNLVCFKYHQIDSPMAEIVAQQARGLILDEAKDWAIVSYSYSKFFNYGEGHAAPIDWATARVYDKLDGSLMVLYPYDGKWQVQSSGTADASGRVGAANLTFRELFWQTWETLGYALPPVMPYSLSFEMLTPFNRIVVPQKEARLILHGVRNLETFQEEDPATWASKHKWEAVKTYSFHSWEALLAASQTLKPEIGEGYIVCDATFQRVKVKSPQYVALHQLKDSLSPKRVLEVVLLNEGDEVLAYFPELTKPFEEIKARVEKLSASIETSYAEHKAAPDQKSFALAVKHLPYSAILFNLRGSRIQAVKEGLLQMHLDKVADLIDLKDFGEILI
jgi:RNA ligase